MFSKFSWLLLGMVFVLACENKEISAKPNVVFYEPAKIELIGTLKHDVKYGPPNYGENPETDEKIDVYSIVLSEAISVEGSAKSELNSETVENITEIQLLLSKDGRASAATFVDNKVVVKGSLSHGVSGHHFTDVVLDVDSIGRHK